MKCHVCGREGKIYSEYIKGYLCSSCYRKMIYKRISQTIRKNKMLHVGEEIVLLKDSSLGFEILKKYFEDVSKKFPLKIRYRRRKGVKKIVSSKYGDLIAADFLSVFLDKKKLKEIKKVEKKKSETIVYPLFYVTEKELINIAKIKKLKVKKEKESDEVKLIHAIEKRKPGVIHAVLHMYDKINKYL